MSSTTGHFSSKSRMGSSIRQAFLISDASGFELVANDPQIRDIAADYFERFFPTFPFDGGVIWLDWEHVRRAVVYNRKPHEHGRDERSDSAATELTVETLRDMVARITSIDVENKNAKRDDTEMFRMSCGALLTCFTGSYSRPENLVMGGQDEEDEVGLKGWIPDDKKMFANKRYAMSECLKDDAGKVCQRSGNFSRDDMGN